MPNHTENRGLWVSVAADFNMTVIHHCRHPLAVHSKSVWGFFIIKHLLALAQYGEDILVLANDYI